MNIGRYLRMEERRAGEPIPDTDEPDLKEVRVEVDCSVNLSDTAFGAAESESDELTKTMADVRP